MHFSRWLNTHYTCTDLGGWSSALGSCRLSWSGRSAS